MSTFSQRLQFHSLYILGLLLLILIIGSVGVGFLIQQNPIIQKFDIYFYNLLVQQGHWWLIDQLIVPFNFNFIQWAGPMPSYLYIEVLLALIFLLFGKRSLFLYAVYSIIVGSIVAYWITYLDWRFVFRERPFLSLPNNVDAIGRSAWSALSSYPSGHARETTLYSTIIANYIPQLKWIMVLFVIFIAYSRVYIGAHFPTDVIAGVLIGYLAAKFSLISAREIQLMITNRKGVEHEEKPRA